MLINHLLKKKKKKLISARTGKRTIKIFDNENVDTC